MKKRIISIILAFVICFSVCSLGLSAFAAGADAPVDGGEPTRYSVIDMKSSSITISGVTADCKGYVRARYSTSLKITLELQKLSSGAYSTVKTWSGTKTGLSLSVSGSRIINILSTYRLKVTTTAGNETTIEYKYP